MGKNMFVGVIAVMAIVMLVLLAIVMGVINIDFSFLPSDDMSPEGLDTGGSVTPLYFSERDIHFAICFLTGKDLPFVEHQVFIRGLKMQMWGIDDTMAHTVMMEYDTKNVNDGYTLLGTGTDSGMGWTAYFRGWYNDFGYARAIIVGDGSAIQNGYGYDVVLCTMHGPITDFNDYWTFLNSY